MTSTRPVAVAVPVLKSSLNGSGPVAKVSGRAHSVRMGSSFRLKSHDAAAKLKTHREGCWFRGREAISLLGFIPRCLHRYRSSETHHLGQCTGDPPKRRD